MNQSNSANTNNQITVDSFQKGETLEIQLSSIAEVLEPLTPESFNEVINEVEQKLRVVSQAVNFLNTDFSSILDSMLQAMRRKVGELLSADRVTIFLLDADKEQLWTNVEKAGADGTVESVEIRIPTSPNSIAGEVATYKKIINIPFDFFDNPRSAEGKKQYERTGYRTYTMLSMPVLTDDNQLVAVVELINKLVPNSDPKLPLDSRINRQGFTVADQALFAQFAPAMRLILESSQAFYLAAQKQRAAEALMKAALSLGQSLDLEATLQKVMDEAKKLMNSDRSTLWLLDGEREDLWTKIQMPDGSLKELRIPMGMGFAGRVAISGETLNIPFDLYDHPDSETSKRLDPTNGYRTCSLLCMPVYNSEQELIGVTQLVNKRLRGDFPEYDPQDWPKAPDCFRASFNKSDEELMKAFNLQAGVALENAKLFAKVKKEQQTQQHILANLSNGLIATDEQGHIVAIHPQADDLVMMAASLNQLIQRAVDYTHELELARQTLEEKIQKRTEELEHKNRQLQEANEQLQNLYHRLQRKSRDLHNTLRKLQWTQAQLIQNEKMSSLGQMVAGIAHEFNNPVNFIYGNVSYVSRYAQDLMELVQLYQQEYKDPSTTISDRLEEIDFDFLVTDLNKAINSIKVGGERIREIVLNLRNFSRLDEAEMKSVNLHEGIETTLTLLQHRLVNKIEIIKTYGALPYVDCYPAQLNQVFLNIINNAIDALLEDKELEAKRIEIITCLEGTEKVKVIIRNNGPVIPLQVQSKLFDPFFTTKPVGQGTGLGLAISYQIVQKHEGEITYCSSLEWHAEFAIVLPIKHAKLT